MDYNPKGKLNPARFPATSRPMIEDFNEECPTPMHCSIQVRVLGVEVPQFCNTCGFSWSKSRRAHYPDLEMPNDE